MGRIFYIMGKSASGKDKIYGQLLEDETLKLKNMVLYTTRPIRVSEQDGKQYYFVDEKKLEELRAAGRIIEERTYQTAAGPWTYFTADNVNIDLERDNYLGIGTLESYSKLREYYGSGRIVPIYIEVSDENRMQRAIKREMKQENPNYKELCRRFLADCDDFSEEKIAQAGIEKRFDNNGDLADCMGEVEEYIRGML